MDRKTKERVVADLHDKLKDVRLAVLVDYSGMNVEKITSLRNELRKSATEFRVTKNTLLGIASKGTDFDVLEEYFEGPLAIAISYEDEVEPTKALVNFAKLNEKMEIKAGILDGKFLSKEEISVLAQLPGRDVLIGKILSVLVATQASLVNVLNGVPRSFVQVLDAYRAKK
ncbi:MAG: 50S ribosomal protein L10 [Thermodesulfobacteriota bacterium]|nr:50S ribosomal protein L10 [Thermodesulfobacteriota bacterium]